VAKWVSIIAVRRLPGTTSGVVFFWDLRKYDTHTCAIQAHDAAGEGRDHHLTVYRSAVLVRLWSESRVICWIRIAVNDIHFVSASNLVRIGP